MLPSLVASSPPGFEATEPFAALVRFDGPVHVFAMKGEFDRDSSDAAFRACTLPGHLHVVAEMAEVTFMACAGYGALIAAHTFLRGRGGR